MKWRANNLVSVCLPGDQCNPDQKLLLCYDGVGEEGSEEEEEEGDINKRNENVEKIEEKESGRE